MMVPHEVLPGLMMCLLHAQGHLQPALAYARRQHTYVEELRKPSEPAKAASRPGQGGDAASGEDSSSSDSEAEASGDESLQSDSGMSSGRVLACLLPA